MMQNENDDYGNDNEESSSCDVAEKEPADDDGISDAAIARAMEQFDAGRGTVDTNKLCDDKSFELCCFLCKCGGEGHN
eukprot:CAMPEP_0183738968 /NCGR_PEP_ID=MMETSP0737-20130205/55885_1 /TAXON_ID=385413 /ORGANISM="Thalassiosira miniscula, Strain CCMP1093" /LENGTH=77 /DNA_ID=CAMNT_0025973627 /DNA_START=1 /DNA_END=231 /DNA_ORIENTATION=-